jgi:hypothetical protein
MSVVRRLRGGWKDAAAKVDEAAPGESLYAGYDPQMECLMACIEEMSRLEGRKGAAVRRQTLDWLCERFALEDNEKAAQAREMDQ